MMPRNERSKTSMLPASTRKASALSAKDVVEYETAVRADGLPVMVHGPAAEMDRAKAILGAADPLRLDAHSGAKAATMAGELSHAAG